MRASERMKERVRVWVWGWEFGGVDQRFCQGSPKMLAPASEVMVLGLGFRIIGFRDGGSGVRV